MNDELTQVLAQATRLACTAITRPHQAALQASLDQARAVPAELGWERKAAAHAEFFNALADTAGAPRLTPVFNHGAGLVYDLMITAGRSADGIVTNSRNRMLAHGREVLGEQGRSPGQQEAAAGGQREEQPGYLQLEGGQLGLPVARRHRAAVSVGGRTSGAHADRTASGSTRSSHRSTSSTPSI